MTAALRRSVPLLLAFSGFALLGSSVQGVAGIDAHLRSSVQGVPLQHERDCPLDKPVRDREV